MVLHWVMILTAVSELWLLRCLSGESICNRSNIGSINITIELRSDVLLPCYFEPVLLGSDMTADIVAVWTQENEAIPNLLEITLQGDVRSWNIKGGRIKTFSKLSVSGNFSILLHKVNQSDLGLYRCELFKGINCSIAYQDIGLHTGPKSDDWLIRALLIGVGLLLLALLIAMVCLYAKYKEVNVDAATQSGRGSRCTLDNPIYEPASQPRPSSARENEGTSLDNPVYATVKKEKRRGQKRTLDQFYNTFENPLWDMASQPKSGTSPDAPVYATVKRGKNHIVTV